MTDPRKLVADWAKTAPPARSNHRISYISQHPEIGEAIKAYLDIPDGERPARHEFIEHVIRRALGHASVKDTTADKWIQTAARERSNVASKATKPPRSAKK